MTDGIETCNASETVFIDMSQTHEKMVKALQAIVVTRLRDQGFTGSFPHLRRIGREKIDLLTFQFDRHGGGFIIEISKCPIDGITTAFGEYIPPNIVTAWHMNPPERMRLQPSNGSSTSDWFRYDKTNARDGYF